jgi:hypothetical protein
VSDIQSKKSTFKSALLRCALGLERSINDNLERNISIQHMEVLWKGDDKKIKRAVRMN